MLRLLRCLARGPAGLNQSLKEWRVADEMPETCDMVIIVAHGFTTDNQPTKGTIESYLKALEVLEFYEKHSNRPPPEIYFGSFQGSPDEVTEREWKLTAFPEGIYTGSLRTTVEEVWRALTAWRDRHHGHMPKSVIYITDQAHARRAKIVASKMFGRGRVRIVGIQLRHAMDPKSAMATYSGTMWNAFVLQAIWEPAFRVLPGWVLRRFFMKLGQPVARY